MRDHTVTALEFCAGYAGIGLGLKAVLGDRLRTVGYCEIEGFVQANLIGKMEAGLLDAAPIWPNVGSFPYRKFRGLVDILSFGFPCQPVSCAGKRKATEDERWLFDIIADGIVHMRPGVIFAENVEGLLSAKMPDGSSVFGHCISRLEALHYKIAPGLFSASEVGAPHQRKRVFILGVADDLGERGQELCRQIAAWAELGPARDDGGDGELADSGGGGRREGSMPRSIRKGGPAFAGNADAWPSRPGEPQHAWEPPRVVGDSSARGCGERGDAPRSECGGHPDGADEGVEHSAGARCDGQVEGPEGEARDEARLPVSGERCGDGADEAIRLLVEAGCEVTPCPNQPMRWHVGGYDTCSSLDGLRELAADALADAGLPVVIRRSSDEDQQPRQRPPEGAVGGGSGRAEGDPARSGKPVHGAIGGQVESGVGFDFDGNARFLGSSLIDDVANIRMANDPTQTDPSALLQRVRSEDGTPQDGHIPGNDDRVSSAQNLLQGVQGEASTVGYKASAREVLFALWRAASAETIQRQAGEYERILAETVLQSGLRICSFTPRICFFVWCVQSGHEVKGWGLRGMWIYEYGRDSSQGSEPLEQFKRELGYAMCQLSYEIALARGQAVEAEGIMHGVREASERAWVLSDALPEMEEVWRSSLNQTVWEKGCFVEASSVGNRTDELRLLGNGVVPACAELAFRTLLAELLTQSTTP